MASCRVCSAPITWAFVEGDEHDVVPLDDHELLDYGPKRFRIVHDGVQPRVQPVPETSTVRTFVDHRHLCQQPRVV